MVQAKTHHALLWALAGLAILAFLPLSPVRASVDILDLKASMETIETGQVSYVDITFTSPSDIKPDAVIALTFSPFFNLTEVDQVASSEINGTWTLALEGTTVRVERHGDGSMIPAGAEVALRYEDVITPTSNAVQVSFELRVLEGESPVASGTSEQITFYNNPPPVVDTNTIEVTAPSGGEVWAGGTEQIIAWAAGGADIAVVDLSLSTDGGRTFAVPIAVDQTVTGSLSWLVPNTPTEQAHIRVSGKTASGIAFMHDITNALFTILEGEEPVVEDDPEPLSVLPNTRVRGTTHSAVYFLAEDGRRYVFPSETTYMSWYEDFEGVSVVSDEDLADFQLGARIRMAPGRLIKIQSVPFVYLVVDAEGTLRHIANETIAEAIFGAAWNTLITDISETQFVDYTVGEVIDEVEDYVQPERPEHPVSLLSL